MKSTSAPLLRIRAVYEANLREISQHIGQIGELHTVRDRPAPETYLAVTQAIRSLRESWRRHIEIDRALFAGMFSERIAEENEVIDRRMTAILSASWPRSVEAGILSIRTGILDILASICRQLEEERDTISSELFRMELYVRAHASIATEETQLAGILVT